MASISPSWTTTPMSRPVCAHHRPRGVPVSPAQRRAAVGPICFMDPWAGRVMLPLVQDEFIWQNEGEAALWIKVLRDFRVAPRTGCQNEAAKYKWREKLRFEICFSPWRGSLGSRGQACQRPKSCRRCWFGRECLASPRAEGVVCGGDAEYARHEIAVAAKAGEIAVFAAASEGFSQKKSTPAYRRGFAASPPSSSKRAVDIPVRGLCLLRG